MGNTIEPSGPGRCSPAWTARVSIRSSLMRTSSPALAVVSQVVSTVRPPVADEHLTNHSAGHSPRLEGAWTRPGKHHKSTRYGLEGKDTVPWRHLSAGSAARN